MSEKGIVAIRINAVFDKYGYDRYLSWDEIVNHLKNQGETDKMLITETLQEFITQRNACYEESRGYAANRHLGKIKNRDSWREAHTGKIVSRNVFDCMDPQEKMSFITNGGAVE